MIAQLCDGAPGTHRIGDIEQRVNLFAPGQPLSFGQLTLPPVLLGFEQAVELQGGLFLPVQLQQVVEQFFLLVFPEQTVGQAQVQGIPGVDWRAGKAEKQAELAWQTREEPAGADIGVQADTDFRHGQTAAWRDDAHAGALQQAHATAEHMPVAPAQQGFGVSVQTVIQAIFCGEEVRGQWRHLTRVVATSLGQAAHLTAGTEGLGSGTAQQYADDVRVIGPDRELLVEHLDHRQ
ncbi:hypothetical protein D3C84_635840 [compost metagenome]